MFFIFSDCLSLLLMAVIIVIAIAFMATNPWFGIPVGIIAMVIIIGKIEESVKRKGGKE